MAASNSIRLFVVSGSPPASSFSLLPMRRSTAHPPGPGLPRQAPSVKISARGSSLTSGDELARKLEDHPLRAVIRLLFGHLEPFRERVDNFAHEDLGSRSACGDPDSARLSQPIPVDVAS